MTASGKYKYKVFIAAILCLHAYIVDYVQQNRSTSKYISSYSLWNVFSVVVLAGAVYSVPANLPSPAVFHRSVQINFTMPMPV